MTDKYFFIDLDNESEKRFEISKFFGYTDNYDPLTSFLHTEVQTLPAQGFFKVQGQDGRPDLISFEIYNDTQYWWVLMIYNNLQSVEDFVTGLDLKYPSISSMEDLYFGLKLQEQANSRL